MTHVQTQPICLPKGRDQDISQPTNAMVVTAYWLTTSMLAFVLLSGGAAYLARQPAVVEGIVRLGYPVYLPTILGVWKVLGGIALLAPRLPMLKEWAYAGVIFDFTGAAASHWACGDYGPYAFHLIVPLVLVAITAASWALRPPSRRCARSACTTI